MLEAVPSVESLLQNNSKHPCELFRAFVEDNGSLQGKKLLVSTRGCAFKPFSRYGMTASQSEIGPVSAFKFSHATNRLDQPWLKLSASLCSIPLVLISHLMQSDRINIMSSPPDSLEPKDKAEEEKKEGQTMNPYDAYWREFWSFARKDPENVSSLLIRDILVTDDDGTDFEVLDDDDDEFEPSKFTALEVCTVRHVLMTKKRNEMLDVMEEYVLGDQANHCVMTFDTSFSYEILDGFTLYKATSWKLKTLPADRFDSLFAYTYNLSEHDVWMYDNEGGMHEMVKDLAKMWNDLLKNSNEVLEIDGEYTRQGVMQLLYDFKETVESCYSDPPFEFHIEETQCNAADARMQRFLREFGDYVPPIEG